MQDVERILGQDAHRIWSTYQQQIGAYRLRGISTFLFFVSQEGDPQCEDNVVPRKARAFICGQQEVLDAKLREIDNWLSHADSPIAGPALRKINDRCINLVMLAVWKRRAFGYRVLEPDFAWLEELDETVH